jgi:hypothetical protein
LDEEGFVPMQVQMRSARLPGCLGFFLILAALVFVPLVILLGFVRMVFGLLGGLVSLFIRRKPRPTFEGSRRSPEDESIPSGKILDVEYEVKNEPKTH